MKYFPFDMTKSKISLIISLVILCVSMCLYVILFRKVNLTGFIVLGLIALLSLINFTHNCISIVTVDVDTIVINTLLIRDRMIYVDDIDGYDYAHNRITLIMNDGKKYRLPSGLTHTKRFLDTLNYMLRSGDSGHQAVS